MEERKKEREEWRHTFLRGKGEREGEHFVMKRETIVRGGEENERRGETYFPQSVYLQIDDKG